MLADDDALVVGRVTAAHGIKGWVKVVSFTDPRENIFSYGPWYLKGPDGWQAVKLTNGRPQGKGLVARIDACDDRTLAETTQVGREIAVPRSALPPAGEGEYYWSDLVGLQVRLTDGRLIGVIRRMLETGANDVMVVQGNADSIDRKERLVPWIMEQVVIRVDLSAGLVEVDWDPDF